MRFKTPFEKHGATTYRESFLYQLPELKQILPIDITSEFEYYHISVAQPYLAIEVAHSKNKQNRFCRPILLNVTRDMTLEERTFVKSKCDDYFGKKQYILYHIEPLTHFL